MYGKLHTVFMFSPEVSVFRRDERLLETRYLGWGLKGLGGEENKKCVLYIIYLCIGSTEEAGFAARVSVQTGKIKCLRHMQM